MFENSFREVDRKLKNDILDIIIKCHDISNLTSFRALIENDLPKIVPYTMAACGIGDRKTYTIDQVININFPEAYLGFIIKEEPNRFVLNSAVVKKWSEKVQTIIFNDLQSLDPSNDKRANALTKACVENALITGVADISGTKTSLFSFASIEGGIKPIHSNIIELIIPHLHKALVRFCYNIKKESDVQSALTAREISILGWLYKGYSNQDIADHTKISINTVRNHIQSILRKLEVSNRTQAIAAALSNGLLHDNKEELTKSKAASPTS